MACPFLQKKHTLPLKRKTPPPPPIPLPPPPPGLEVETKSSIRRTLASILLGRNSSLKYFVKNKLAKLLVDVGRHDWPHEYPDFMDNIFSLIQSPETTLLGLILLQVRVAILERDPLIWLPHPNNPPYSSKMHLESSPH